MMGGRLPGKNHAPQEERDDGRRKQRGTLRETGKRKTWEVVNIQNLLEEAASQQFWLTTGWGR